jgi:putative CocE/NonD family hydrolase
MTVRLWVSVEGAPDVHVFAGVEKWRGGQYVPFEGSYGYGRDRVTTGWQRAALRELDPDASAPHEPVPSLLHPQPLGAGEVVRLEFALAASSTLFRAGETLRLVVSGRWLWSWNPLTGSFPARYRPSARARCTLHWSGGMPAALTVPVIPRARG